MTIKIIGVIACKGGVGKSTLALNLALSLNYFKNKKIGLFDADIHGPNHPNMLGIKEKNLDINDKILKPKKIFNIVSMSMGYFLNDNASVMLRGPMISNTITYLFKKTDWGNLDYLIIDFPPGTGDVYLSLLRDISFSNIILITTPQTSSIIDIRRSIVMLQKFNIKNFFLIENMIYYECKNCLTKNYLNITNTDFDKLVNDFNIKNIYKLPFDADINNSVNSGKPFIIYNKENILINLFKSITENITNIT